MPPPAVRIIGTKSIPSCWHRRLRLSVFVFSADLVPALEFRSDWLFCDKTLGCELEAKRAFPPSWRVLECGKRVWKKANQPTSASAAFEAFGCSCLQGESPCARPRTGMYRLEILEPCCSQPYRGTLTYPAHSHAPSFFLDGSNFRLANLIMAGSHFAGGQGNTKARSCEGRCWELQVPHASLVKRLKISD
jgi:hypothetical protein